MALPRVPALRARGGARPCPGGPAPGPGAANPGRGAHFMLWAARFTAALWAGAHRRALTATTSADSTMSPHLPAVGCSARPGVQLSSPGPKLPSPAGYTTEAMPFWPEIGGVRWRCARERSQHSEWGSQATLSSATRALVVGFTTPSTLKAGMGIMATLIVPDERENKPQLRPSWGRR